MSAKLITAGATDAGRIRPINEDSILVRQTMTTSESVLLAVADGMGGLEGGFDASSIAVATLVENLATIAHPSIEQLQAAFQIAHRAIWSRGKFSMPPRRMGTTLVACAGSPDQLILASVGDSRAYLFTESGAVQLTVDHTLVAEQVAAGLLTPQGARNSPQSHLLTRCLGAQEDAPQVDVLSAVGLPVRGCLLLCSDGLHGMLELDEIASLAVSYPPGLAVRLLVDAANERGGKDNISAVIVARQS
jgi:protein phosphatase